jgi:ABC-type phosphate transport system substrate-binding protein
LSLATSSAISGFKAVLLAAMVAGGRAFATEIPVVVVVSAQSPLRTLSKSQVADIFLGKTRTFPDNRQAEPIDSPDGGDAYAAFYGAFTGLSSAQLKAHWSKIIFTGRGRPPPQLTTEEKVVRALLENPNAISYLPLDAVDPQLRVVSVVKENPG